MKVLAILLFSILLLGCKKEIIKEGRYTINFQGDYYYNGIPISEHTDTDELFISNVSENSFEIECRLNSVISIDVNDSVFGKIYTNQAYYESPEIRGEIERKWGKCHVSGEYEASGSLSGTFTPIKGTFTIEPE